MYFSALAAVAAAVRRSFLRRQVVHVLGCLLGVAHQLALLLAGRLLLLTTPLRSTLPVLILVLGLMDIGLRSAREVAVSLVRMLRRGLLAAVKRAGRLTGQAALATVAREPRATSSSSPTRGTLVVPIPTRLVHLRRTWKGACSGGAAAIRLLAV